MVKKEENGITFLKHNFNIMNSIARWIDQYDFKKQ
jgi:hypothetical protein